MTADSLHPRTGGRVILDLVSVGDEIVYTAGLHTPTESWSGRAVLAAATGEVAWTWETPPPAWLAELAHKFLRGAWRNRRGDAAEEWPARISRWRSGE